MSLITRCPACGTMFKVVTDQLKVSQGWVRCGQCTEVFDAAANLLPRHATPRAATRLVLTPEAAPEDLQAPDGSPSTQAVQTLQDAGDSAPVVPTPEPIAEPLAESPVEPLANMANSPLLPAFPSDADEMPPDSGADFDPASWKQALQERQQGAAQLPPDTSGDRQALLHTPTADQADSNAHYTADSDFAEADAAPDVSFVRDARRKAFWRRPVVRWVLGLLLLVLLAVLALQWVMQRKDTLTATEPRLAPLLQMLCRQLGCEIVAPRHIEALVIDSSTFKKLGPDVYRLTFALKNTGVTFLEIPSLEVTLTDTQDQAVVRRVLTPAQFGASGATLAGQSELAGLVTLKVAGAGDGGRSAAPTGASSAPAASLLPAAPLRVAGYRILAFYP